MRNIALTLLGFFALTTASSQQGLDSNQFTRLSHYVFPDFIKGTVKQKNGGLQEAMLNYNSMTQEMIFVQNGGYLALDQIGNIDTIYIEGRKFVPAGEVFYEVVSGNPVSLFVNHKCRVIPPGNPAGYGSTTQTSSVGNISKIANNSGFYSLTLPNDFKIIPETEFLLKRGNDYVKITNAKQVSKFFPSKADAIQEYVKKNKTNFGSQEDVLKLIRFCNQS